MWRKLSVFVLFSKKEIKKDWADTRASPPSFPSSSSLRSLYWPAAFRRQKMFKSSGCFCDYLWMHSRLKTMSWWCSVFSLTVGLHSWQSFHTFLINTQTVWKRFNLISYLENKQLGCKCGSRLRWRHVSHIRKSRLKITGMRCARSGECFFSVIFNRKKWFSSPNKPKRAQAEMMMQTLLLWSPPKRTSSVW